ncbi:IclR family transcriptional regulator [Desulfovibrio ferrophilus]|uniref:Transcriptional regulator, IclR family n=1 Tax=Desulfovibrio ferrophilus TaxID=241368 RepID=A0A2Z6B2T6_9BACT|nr:IclR family transcriptional regulator C-terminal domain-containing protein [Desulfovibrio ferrophilus]BBD09773.1 transcriptional regulator, IclR family [Desulfovibrio ferrophilus]
MAQDIKKRNDALFVASLDRGMCILEAFHGNRKSLGLTEITEITGLNRSAVQRFLHTWEQLGYLSKDQTTKRFTLTPRVMTLGYNFLRGNRLVEIATPFLLEARERTGNSMYLGTLDGLDLIYLVRLPQRFLLFESTLPGRRIPAFCGARAILAHMDDKDVLDIMDRSEHNPITPHTVLGTEANMTLVERVREKGYCVSSQEFLAGEIAVSAPVINAQGTPLAAVYISAKLSEWPEERAEQELAPVALEVAGIIGAQF